MHDCNGKPIEMFAKVRPATADEMTAAGHTEGTAPYVKPGRVIAQDPNGACCEVNVAAGLEPVGFAYPLPGSQKQPIFFTCEVQSGCKAKQLVVEG